MRPYRTFIATLALLLGTGLFAQEPASADALIPGNEVTIDEANIVTISSKGADVRSVLFDLFTQAKRSFVLEPEVRHVLYLALTGVEFEEALNIVCRTASLKFEVENGIYFVTKLKPGDKPAAEPLAKPAASTKPLGKLTEQDLQKRVTTRLSMADIRTVFAEFAKQTGIVIEVSDKVPNYKVDAYLIDTSLKYALDVVTRAAGLSYERTENRSLRINAPTKGS
jgi:type II secretory pathway component HofQ